MASKKNKPVIFLAFANEKDPRTRERYLRSLGEEVRRLRRILRKVAADDYGDLGDTSTLAEPAVVDNLIENRQNRAG